MRGKRTLSRRKSFHKKNIQTKIPNRVREILKLRICNSRHPDQVEKINTQTNSLNVSFHAVVHLVQTTNKRYRYTELK